MEVFCFRLFGSAAEKDPVIFQKIKVGFAHALFSSTHSLSTTEISKWGYFFRNIWDLHTAAQRSVFAALWLDKPVQLNNVAAADLFTKLVFQKGSESLCCLSVGSVLLGEEFFELSISFQNSNNLWEYYPNPPSEAGGNTDSMLTMHLNSLGNKHKNFKFCYSTYFSKVGCPTQ